MPSEVRMVLVLANEHIEDDTIDLVVKAVVGDNAHLLARLTVAVHATLALFVARGVPGEIVVDDRVEVFLQVDALTQAVGANEHALRRLAQLENAVFSLDGRQQPGNGINLDTFR